ncbi:cell-cycle-associated protein kinase CLK, putative [Babesia caballi]|uniref:Cell-cycle-associated protein kinase CLK, putative n=1 Tax=Babesia caballi TaxID=5871 RepID=A0AAV4M140_BABCB|nr:cell-cycle-associated protein kinase CLK, putative [Babesia caballi]
MYRRGGSSRRRRTSPRHTPSVRGHREPSSHRYDSRRSRHDRRSGPARRRRSDSTSRARATPVRVRNLRRSSPHASYRPPSTRRTSRNDSRHLRRSADEGNRDCRSSRRRDRRRRDSSPSERHHHHHRRSDAERSGRRRHSGARSRSGRRREQRSSDRIVHFKWVPGMRLGDYKVLNKIGDGTFGRVLLCEKDGERFAVKVVRDVAKYVSSAKIEVDILNDIHRVDAGGDSHCVVLHGHFLYKDRIMCLVFEHLGDSLYDFMKRNDYKGFFMADIQKIAFQLLKGLSFLKKNRLIHTDLKPENVLLTCAPDQYIEVPFPRSTTGMMTKRPASADIKIIDFGSTIYEDDYHSSIINTRQYRSPEVILDVGWSYASDMWSLGCILIELYTGNLLFNTHSHLEHLAMMEQAVGQFPPRLLEQARKTGGRRYLHPSREGINWPEGAYSLSSEERVAYCRNVMELVKPEHRPFAEFIKYVLNPDPSQRPTPEDALEHEFFVLQLPEN